MRTLDEDLSLDPADWSEFRTLAHRMVDEMLDGISSIREQPVWREMSEPARDVIRNEPLPRTPQGEQEAYEAFLAHVKPYRLGNPHPRFHGWVMGSGVPLATMADMLAADIDPNCAGGNQGSYFVEMQVIAWMREALGYDPAAGGILASGGSLGNLTALNVARHAKAGFDVRKLGIRGGPPLTFYGSTETHSWAWKAAELMGLGSDSFRTVPVDPSFRVDVAALRDKIQADRKAGMRPFCIIANVGTVNTGAIDDLDALADLSQEEGLWLHADGAFGALASVSPKLRPLVKGLDRVDSVVFDLHKWMYLPFEIACVLVKDAAAHRAAFAKEAAYLATSPRGFITEGLQFSETGYELSRGFKALKAWMCLKAYGMDRFARAIEMNVEQASHLTDLVRATPDLELAAPTSLNIVCFRYRPVGVAQDELNSVNEELLLRLQERGIAVPSSTTIDGKFVIRAAIVNHRTRFEDMDALVADVQRIGAEVVAAR